MIADAITEFGSDAYLVFFGILDMMAEDFDIKNPGICTFSVKYLTRNLQISHHKLLKVLEYFKNYPKENGRLLYELNGNKITITCIRLKELADEWTNKQLRRKSGVNRDLLPPKEVEREVEIEEEIKKDIKETPPTPSLRENYYSPEFQEYKKQSIEILNYLNQTCKRKLPELSETLSPIQRRLQEGFSPDDLKRVIDTKHHDPHFQKNRNLYSPDTLFGEKFAKYLSESPDDYEQTGKPKPKSETEYPIDTEA